eukprot:CAMPEP_0170547440 /NCGR_PEP_ID=MMETSP0211-20121228/5836_1 /TAXON_ID=311385 /ORGANISM="Pseudokeronopsis sp., Strain OXSARD2" /LENGTH=89 /DNA_ID=CAMNT_0010852487 /DNA_START=458 /DNA_END=727 /DNA_ORIENTATION=+
MIRTRVGRLMNEFKDLSLLLEKEEKPFASSNDWNKGYDQDEFRLIPEKEVIRKNHAKKASGEAQEHALLQLDTAHFGSKNDDNDRMSDF